MKKINITKDRSFYRSFFSVWSMLVLFNIITLGVNLADNVMVSAYSEAAMAGVSAVNQVQFLFQQLLLGAGDAAVVLSSQYWGQKRTEPIKRIATGALLLGAGLALLLFVLAAVTPETLVSMFTNDAAIHAAGVEYLRIMKYSYLIFAMTHLLLAVLRSVETVRIGFWVSISTLVVNCGLNYLLIEGRLGAPRLGVTGAAIATLSARVAELIIVVVYILCLDKKLCWKLKDFFRWDKLLAKDYFKLVRSFLTTSLLFGGAVMLQTVILGHMDAGDGAGSTIAANSIASTLYQMLKVAIVGASSAAAVLIGKAIGSGRMDVIKSYAQTLQLMFVGIGVCTSTLLFILRVPIVNLYAAISPDLAQETYQMALDFILVLCVTGFGTAYQMPVATGIIRGGGDAKFVLINDLISIWGIVLPVSLLAAFVFKWPPVAVIACLNADQVFKCGAAFIKVNRYRWMKKLTRADI
jgi:putative MATE family efflux protein